MNLFDQIAFVLKEAPALTNDVSVLYGTDSGVEVIMLRNTDGTCYVVRVDQYA